ncbi:MauE/DoxX family redox-associated membrane protein [Chitinophaga sp. LS1]|uniref:MauE/DoxX family redox-associated membrane protein n=1 Tax=Chitinophaga sp. LS1 TaxID=3051176 RepID=UPI0039F10B16
MESYLSALVVCIFPPKYYCHILKTIVFVGAIFKIASMLIMKKNAFFLEVICMLFVILFVYTAISKFLDFSLFSAQIGMSPVLAPVAKIIAWVVPLAEIIDSVMLMVPALRLRGLYIALGLMLSFTIYIILLMKLSAHLPCSCGGVIELLSWRDHLILNCVYILLAIAGIWIYRRSHHMARLSSSSPHP